MILAFDRHRVDVPRQGAFEPRFADEGRASVQQDRQEVPLCVLPQRVDALVVRPKAGVHRQQLDAAEPEFLVADAHLALPPFLRGVDREEPDEVLRILRDVLSDVTVVDPQVAAPRHGAEDDRPRAARRGVAVLAEVNGRVDFHARTGPRRLGAEAVAEVGGIRPRVAVDVDRGVGIRHQRRSI